MPEGKWVSKENLQTFWQLIRSNLTSLVTTEVNAILPPIIQEDVIDAYIPDILGNFAEVEDASTATKNYAIGDYLVLNKHFYKVTAAIASGDTLVEGTNIERTNVGAEVNAIRTQTEYTEAGTITLNSTYCSPLGTQTYLIVGKLISIHIFFEARASIPINTLIASLPQNHNYSHVGNYGVATVQNATGGGARTFGIAPTGDITAGLVMSAGERVVLDVVTTLT